MAAIGGYHHGFDQVSEALTEASKSQNFDSRDSAILLAAFDDDLGVTVELETPKRQIDGKPADMTLRATMVYRGLMLNDVQTGQLASDLVDRINPRLPRGFRLRTADGGVRLESGQSWVRY